ncbi:RDD family protein [Nitrososphaera sp.]|uniref:RDD family protein n=1 Tax=Nitrososphaera sp. TaxID=1971748 RepID=UPI00307F7E14
MSSAPTSPEGAASQPEVLLAKWSDRFLAWLIDFIIVSIVVNATFAAAAFPFWFGRMMSGREWWDAADPFGGPLHYAVTSTVFFFYWLFFESTRGQSIGKKLLKIKTTDLSGSKAPDVKSAAIQSFGKAFLLPIDVLLGWIFTNEKRQRIFNRASDTIVIRLKDGSGGSGGEPQPGVTYRKD